MMDPAYWVLIVFGAMVLIFWGICAGADEPDPDDMPAGDFD